MRRIVSGASSVPALLVAWMLCLVMTLPSHAWATQAPIADDPTADAVSVDLEDGAYRVEVSLEGGSGRASVTSPAQLEVREGKAVALIEWSSPNYDYMLVADKCYLPVNDEGNSVFEIPVLAFDEPFDVVGDTTAMSVPHEVSYTLLLSSQSIVADEGAARGSLPSWAPLAAAAVIGAAAIAWLLTRTSRNRSAKA